MQSMMGAYMEQSKRMFVQMQEQIEQQTRSMMSGFKFPGFTPPGGEKAPPQNKQ
jgi:polyhydroxyalkanoate synthesis regulator protein